MNYSVGDAVYTVSLEPLPDGSFRARIGDRVLTVQAQAVDGGWRLLLDGCWLTVYTAAQGSDRYASVEGTAFQLKSVQPGRRRAASAAGGGLTARMPGQVREVLAAVGDSVSAGQTLLLLEAMKMEIRVTAPADGRVKRLLVAAGDVVDRGQPLLELE